MRRRAPSIAASLAAFALIATGFAGGRAARADETAVCVASHRDAQRARAEHHLLEAKQKLVACGQTTCPELIRSDCTQWLAEIEPRIPTVVLGLDLESPAVLASARVRIDGGANLVLIDGKTIAVDPGEHVFRFEIPGYPPIEERVVVLEGEQARKVFALVQRSSASSSSSVPPVAIVFGAVSLASFGVFAGFGIAGVAKKDDLDALGCRPNCASANVDVARRDFAVADVALGVGVAALAVGVIIVALRPSRASTPRFERASLAVQF